jgi:hypothetical protein
LAIALAMPSAASYGAPLSVEDAFKPALIQWMRLSPDGRRVLAFGWNKEATGAVVMDLATMRPKLLRSALGGSPWEARWLSKDLVAVAIGGETQIFDTEGKLLRRVGGFFAAALQPDAGGHERVLVHSERGDLDRVDVRTGDATHLRFAWPNDATGRWLIDRDGVPRVVTTMNRDKTMLTHWYRASADGRSNRSCASTCAGDPRRSPQTAARSSSTRARAATPTRSSGTRSRTTRSRK